MNVSLPWLPVSVEASIEDDYDIAVRADLPDRATSVETLLHSRDVGRRRGLTEVAVVQILHEAIVWSAKPGLWCRQAVSHQYPLLGWDSGIARAWAARDIELYEALRWGRSNPHLFNSHLVFGAEVLDAYREMRA